jgi:hypothetical protein
MSLVAKRKTTGVYGAFAARNPVGKVAGLLVALLLLAGCWQWTKYRCGRVAWAEKGMYVTTAWDGMVDPGLRALHLGGTDEQYVVVVEQASGDPLFTNEAFAAGRKWRRVVKSIDPRILHGYLREYVYENDPARLAWPLWFLWPILLVACLVTGQIVDMLRLRKARQTGVFLRGNRITPRGEWNARANEETLG